MNLRLHLFNMALFWKGARALYSCEAITPIKSLPWNISRIFRFDCWERAWVGRSWFFQFAVDSDPDTDWQELAASLVECHADPLFLAPDDMTGLVVPVCGEHQREMFGDANRAANVQRRPDAPTYCEPCNR